MEKVFGNALLFEEDFKSYCFSHEEEKFLSDLFERDFFEGFSLNDSSDFLLQSLPDREDWGEREWKIYLLSILENKYADYTFSHVDDIDEVDFWKVVERLNINTWIWDDVSRENSSIYFYKEKIKVKLPSGNYFFISAFDLKEFIDSLPPRASIHFEKRIPNSLLVLWKRKLDFDDVKKFVSFKERVLANYYAYLDESDRRYLEEIENELYEELKENSFELEIKILDFILSNLREFLPYFSYEEILDCFSYQTLEEYFKGLRKRTKEFWRKFYDKCESYGRNSFARKMVRDSLRYFPQKSFDELFWETWKFLYSL